jgi:hypothetical protein
MFEPDLGPNAPAQGPDPNRPLGQSPLYSSKARLPKNNPTDPEVEMLGMQNLVQQGQMADLREYEEELWRRAEELKGQYRERLGPASKRIKG